MTVLASEIIDRVRTQLVDQAATKRWSDDELLRHLSDGQRTIAAISPDVITKVAVVQLAAGTRQSLPADGNQLLSIMRNMGTDGATPGRAVRVIRRDVIDDQNPNWHAEPKMNYTYNYVYDPLDPKAFFVYPPSNGSGRLEINYSYTPVEIDALTDEVDVPDLYVTALTDYVLSRAHMKDADSSGGSATAGMFLQLFQAFMQTTGDAEVAVNPNLQTMPFNPATKGTAK